ncbi:MAG TPA: hypothetical protein VHJ34_08430 [Actinomycetota bacterium]|nr:hypothetical protein [Actinomycetota bacterium]
MTKPSATGGDAGFDSVRTWDARRKVVATVAIFVLLLAAIVWTAPSASAGYCGHDDHYHSHNGHLDFYHWHDHYPEHGYHWHVWHNHTHGEIFTVRC